jgi:hypothetical protein
MMPVECLIASSSVESLGAVAGARVLGRRLDTREPAALIKRVTRALSTRGAGSRERPGAASPRPRGLEA